MDGPRGKICALQGGGGKRHPAHYRRSQGYRPGDPRPEREAERPCPARTDQTGSVTELVSVLEKKDCG